MLNVQQLELEFGLPLTPKRDLVLCSGSGSIVEDDSGKRYIDCIAGHGVASLGHANPIIRKALEEQSRRLMTCAAGFFSPVRAELLSEISRITPAGLDRSFLCNSGAESVEAAIKFARITTGRRNIVCARRSFHGRTMGALSATHNPKYHRGVQPLVPGFDFVSLNDVDALNEAVDESTAAVLLEVIQGEGGVHLAEAEFLAVARTICDASGALLIFDEVQTGFCRTGRIFACEHSGVVPDILCVAKGMGAGMPIGATICNSRIIVPAGSHGSTFGGNPLACAAALATLREMHNLDLARQVASNGSWLLEELQKRLKSPLVREIRGLGLMIGIDLRQRARPYLDELMLRGVLVMTAGATVIRLLPPLVITRNELITVVDTIAETLK